MKLIFRYVSKYKAVIFLAIFIKLLGTLAELLLPYILEYIIDDVVPSGSLKLVLLFGGAMFVTTFLSGRSTFPAPRLTGSAFPVSFPE